MTEKKSDKTIYNVKVVGTYHTTEKKLSRFTEEFKLRTLEAAQSVIKNNLIVDRLSSKYDDFRAIRTMEVVDSTLVSGGEDAKTLPKKKRIHYLNRKSLVSYIGDEGLPINPDYYQTLSDLRGAIVSAEEDPDGFVEREKSKEVERELKRELAELNG